LSKTKQKQPEIREISPVDGRRRRQTESVKENITRSFYRIFELA